MSLNAKENSDKAEKAAKALIPPVPPLNPPFPYTVKAFRPESFGVLDDPPPVARVDKVGIFR